MKSPAVTGRQGTVEFRAQGWLVVLLPLTLPRHRRVSVRRGSTWGERG